MELSEKEGDGMAMKLSDKMRKRASVNMPIYGERVYAWIEEVSQLEEENEILQRYSEFVYEKDYGAEFDGWLALLGETA